MRPSQTQTISTTLSSHLTNTITFIMTTIFLTIPSTLWNFSILALTHLKCAFELLLHNQFSFPSQQRCLFSVTSNTGPEGLIPMKRHSAPGGSAERCAVCLGDVGDGDDVGELRCCHVFHGACLQRWVRSSKLTTCPLCRAPLAAPRRFGESASRESGFGVEVLFFKFCSFDDDRLDNDSWWLR